MKDSSANAFFIVISLVFSIVIFSFFSSAQPTVYAEGTVTTTVTAMEIGDAGFTGSTDTAVVKGFDEGIKIGIINP